ncbi:MAG TPA: FAD/NAD(P)-binding oxidoreductase [Amycolatopsis sp.]|nr:FAD/NAD(P)-binding oxidoreductase [Amycolatopsis sp.]
MTRRIVVLGGGTGGTLVANRLGSLLGREAGITVVDRDPGHVYQPGLVFVPFGARRVEDLVRSRPGRLRSGIAYHNSAVESVAVEQDRVHLADGTELGYDVLVVATGARPVPERTAGMTGPGWLRNVFTFYDPMGAAALEKALAEFEGGHLAVAVLGAPVKSPFTPLEFCFLAEEYFRVRGVRGEVRLSYLTPGDAVVSPPAAAGALAALLEKKGIDVVTGFATEAVDGDEGRLAAADGRQAGFDLAVVVPRHRGAAYLDRSPGLGDDAGFVPADPHTLQSAARPNIFVIGDAAALPAVKVASVAHFQGEVLARNINRFLAGRRVDDRFDGHGCCLVECGSGKALLADFNYDTEPLPGHYPSALGLPLLKESRLAHLGKRMSAWCYWHILVPGRDLPGVASPMPRTGKRFPARTARRP